MKNYLLLAILLITSPMLADKKGPEWNYFEAGFAESEFGELEPNGAFGNLSVLINDNMFLTAGWSSLTQEVTVLSSIVEVKLNESDISMGYRYAMNSSTDVYASLGYVNLETCDLLRACDDDDGLRASVGVRSMVTDSIEIFAAADYKDLGSSDTGAVVGVAYNFTSDFSLKLSYEDADELEVMAISARFEF